MILKWVELDCLHHTPPPLRCSIEMPRSLPRCSPPVRLGRIVRRTMDRWCCLGALFGIFLGLPLTMIVQMHRCAPAATFSRGYYTDPTLEAYGTHHAIESAAWKLPNKLVVVISLSTCDSQEVEDTLSSLGRDVPSDSVRFYSCCEDLRLSSDQCFMHRRLNCSSGRSLSLLTVLNHLWQHEASNHQWFLLASSLTYINYELLVQFLDHLDSEELFYLGRPVRTAEHTTSSWIYCEGGAGVVISRSLLRGLRPGMCSEQEDIKEDALLGCCISEKYHIDCWGGIDKVWSPFNILAPNDWRSLKSADHYSVQERDKKMALYVSYRQVEYWRLQEQLNHSVCVIRQLEQRYNLSSPEEVLKFPSNSALFAEYNPSSDICFQKSRSTDPGDVQSWVIYTRGAFYYGGYAYPRKGFPPWHTVSTSDMVKHFRLNFNWIFQLPLRSQLTFYARYDVNSGIEYSIDLRQKKLSNRANGKSHVNLLAPLMDFKVKETKSLSNERVHFVVPISSGRTDTIHSFIVMYERVCLLTKQLTSLILAVYGEETYTAVTKMINDYQLKYPNANFTVLKGMGTFSRSRALNLGMQELKVDDLAFHCDVDMEITNPGFLDRCRMNTVRGESVYFPEVFKHYNVDLVFRYKKRPKGRLPIRRDLGHWGAYGYGMVCIYKADFLSVGGMDNQTEGWGQEDVDFFTRVLERLIIFRAPDPALRHHWHQKNCSAITTTVEKYNECHDSKTLALGGRKELGRYILELENNED